VSLITTSSFSREMNSRNEWLREGRPCRKGEEKFIVNAKIGQRILVTQEGRIPFYNFLSDEERRLFTTKPKEVTA
jgi:hypothetical protein